MKVSKGRSQTSLIAPAGAPPAKKQKNLVMRRACCAPLKPSLAQTEGKSRWVEDPFGRSPEGSALWWGAGAKPLLAEGETRE